ncbi:MAG: hypothetical protein AAFX39_01960 [Pseudomonadota bacterium]
MTTHSGCEADMVLQTARAATLKALVRAFLEAPATRREEEPSLRHFGSIASALYLQVGEGVRAEIVAMVAAASDLPDPFKSLLWDQPTSRRILIENGCAMSSDEMFAVAIGDDATLARALAKRTNLPDDARGALLARDDIAQASLPTLRKIKLPLTKLREDHSAEDRPASSTKRAPRITIQAAAKPQKQRVLKTIKATPQAMSDLTGFRPPSFKVYRLSPLIAAPAILQLNTLIAPSEHILTPNPDTLPATKRAKLDKPAKDLSQRTHDTFSRALLTGEPERKDIELDAASIILDFAARGALSEVASTIAKQTGQDEHIIQQQLADIEGADHASLCRAIDLDTRDALSLYLLIHGRMLTSADLRAYTERFAPGYDARMHLPDEITSPQADEMPETTHQGSVETEANLGPVRHAASVSCPGAAVRTGGARQAGAGRTGTQPSFGRRTAV